MKSNSYFISITLIIGGMVEGEHFEKSEQDETFKTRQLERYLAFPSQYIKLPGPGNNSGSGSFSLFLDQ